MGKASRKFLLAAVLAFLVLGFAVSRGPAQQSDNPEWLKSGNPCWPTEQQKKQIKAMTGVDANTLKCHPVRISMIWDIDETGHHHSGLGDDRFTAGLRVSFPGYLQIYFNQQKRTQVEDIFLSGPSPCCPAEAEFDASRLEASVLGSAPKGFSSYTFKFFKASGADILYGRDKPGLFELKWRRDGLDNRTEIGGPQFKIQKGVIEEPYAASLLTRFMDSRSYRLQKLADESTDWDDIRPYFEKQDIWQKEFVLEDRLDFPGLDEFYALRGKVTVQVDFAEVQTEEWLITVTGQERDFAGDEIEYKMPGQSAKKLLLSAEFDWLLEGKFKVKKRKGVRSFDGGIITQFEQVPRVLFDATDLFRCDLTYCEGKKAFGETGRWVGLMLGGELQGQSVRIQWMSVPAEACVLCTPKKSSGTKAAFRSKKMGSSEFTSRISREVIPLKNGSVRDGAVLDWLTYRITLKKLR